MNYEDTADLIGDDMGNDPAALASAEAATAEFLQRKPGNRLDYDARFALLCGIIDDEGLPSSAVKAARVILSHHNHRTGYAFPGIDTIAAGMHRSRTQAKAAVKALVEAGWFRVEAGPRRENRNGPNRYFPNLARIDLTGRKSDLSDGFTGRKSDVDGSENRRLTGRKTDVSPVGNPPPNPVDLTRLSEPRENNPASYAHGRESRPDVFLGGEVRDASDKATVTLPEDYQFPADAVTAARARGLQDHDLVRALASFRETVGADKRRIGRWAKSGAAYLATVEAQQAGQPGPNDWVRLSDGKHVKRSWAKPHAQFTDTAGNLWSGEDASGTRKMTPQVTNYMTAVATSVLDSIVISSWDPPKELLERIASLSGGKVQAGYTLRAFRSHFGPYACMDPIKALQQYIGDLPKPNTPASKDGGQKGNRTDQFGKPLNSVGMQEAM